MKLKEMSLFEAAELLDLKIEETTDGLRLTHGEEDPATAYEEVTLEEADQRIADSNEAYERMLAADYSPLIRDLAGKVIVETCSAWTSVSDYIKSLETKED